jgi:hypothetical protein
MFANAKPLEWHFLELQTRRRLINHHNRLFLHVPRRPASRRSHKHLHCRLLQLLYNQIQLKPTAYQESPRTPESRATGLEDGPIRSIEAESRTQGEAQAANEVPEADVPGEAVRARNVPFVLGLDGEEEARHNEARPTDHLRKPVYDV